MTTPAMIKRTYALKGLLQMQHPEGADAQLACLPQAERQALEAISVEAPSKEPFVQPVWEALAAIHHSWIDRLLQKESAPKQELLQKALDGGISPPMRAFLLADLYRDLGIEKAIPASLLPASPLNALLQLSKGQLVRLIAYLGLRDLAAELRKTVDRKAIAQIEEMLTKPQGRYLRKVVREGDPLDEEPIGIGEWLKSQTHLLRLSQEKGLKRLGMAFAGQERSLLWHLVHTLDIGRGTLIVRAAKEEVKPRIAERLQCQALDLARELKFLEESA